jgi:hypothetical protein
MCKEANVKEAERRQKYHVSYAGIWFESVVLFLLYYCIVCMCKEASVKEAERRQKYHVSCDIVVCAYWHVNSARKRTAHSQDLFATQHIPDTHNSARNRTARTATTSLGLR